MNLAQLLDTIPVVQSTGDRGRRFPTPASDQRVHNKQTGDIERWTGSAWVVDFAGGGAFVLTGTGSPESVVTAGPGTVYLQTDGAGNNAWVKATGVGNTGWALLVVAGVTAATIYAASLVGTNVSAGWIQQQEAAFTLGAGNNNNFDPQFITTILAAANAAGSTITGIAGNQSGRQLRIVLVSGGPLTIAHQNVASAVANRIISPTGANLTLQIDDPLDLEYDATAQRWRVVSLVPSGQLEAILAKTVDYTLTADDRTVLVSASGAARTMTLPPAASHPGRVYTIKKTDSSVNTVTIDGNAAETIDGALTKVLTAQYERVTIQCDGANWFIVGS